MILRNTSALFFLLLDMVLVLQLLMLDMESLVILFSNLLGNHIGAAFANRHCNPQKDNLYFCQILLQSGTVAIMCPTMSLVASILFNIIMAEMPLTQLSAIWLETVIKIFQ